MIVVDTHVAVWDALTPEKLSLTARQIMQDANRADGMVLCDISLWEIGMLIKSGQLFIDVDFKKFADLLLQSNRYILSRMTPEIVSTALSLPAELGDDAADRLICATAIHNDARLLTADRKLAMFAEVSTVW